MKQGLHRISIEEHHKIWPAFSKSLEGHLNISPAHAKAYLEAKKERSKAMEFGSAFHDCALQHDTFLEKYEKAPEIDKRTSEYKAWAKAQEGKTILCSEDYQSALQMVEALHRHPIARNLISGGEPEVTAVALDIEHDVLIKVRPDYLRSDNVVVDLKTTDCADFRKFNNRSIYQYRYHVQAAMYLDTLNLALGKKQYDSFVIVAVEKEPPFGIACILIDDLSVQKGRELYRKNLAVFAECVRANHWPGYATEIITSTPPLWALEEA